MTVKNKKHRKTTTITAILLMIGLLSEGTMKVHGGAGGFDIQKMTAGGEAVVTKDMLMGEEKEAFLEANDIPNNYMETVMVTGFAQEDISGRVTPGTVMNMKGFGDITYGIDLSDYRPSQRGTNVSAYLKSAGAAEVMDSINEEAVDAAIASEESKEAEANLWGYDNLGIAHVDNHLNIRKEPSETADLVGKLSRNAACEILETDGEWSRIKSGKVDGYVKHEFLYTGEEAKQKGREVASMIAVVNTRTLKVREEPSIQSAVITLVPIEEKLEVEELLGDWVKILIDDEAAFVSSEYVNIEERLDTAVTLTELQYGKGVSNVKVDLVQYAKQFVGNPYVWGGVSLTRGADCSGFVLSVFAKYGVSLPHHAASQANYGTKVSLSEAQPGDLIFYSKNGRINHVAIYIGGGQVVHASSPKTGIKISNATYRTPAVVKRIIN